MTDHKQQQESNQWSFQLKPDIVYKRLNKEYFELPQTEKLKIARDLLGLDVPLQNDPAQANATIDETPAFVSHKLQRLLEEVDLLDEKEAYETSMFINPEYTGSSKLLLSFLRAERFNEYAAAKRMVEYWERKVDLFGTNKAFRKLTFLDLPTVDHVALEQGGIQALPRLDAAGRAVIFFHRKLYDFSLEHDVDGSKSMQRLLWCVIHDVIDDEYMGENIQKAGMVAFLFNGLSKQEMVLTARMNIEFGQCALSDLMKALPIRLVALHHFQPEVFVRQFLLDVTLASYLRSTSLASYLRSRLVLHHSPDQIVQNLEVYGIHRSMIPKVLGGDLDFDYSEWLLDQFAVFAEEEYYETYGS